MFVHTAFRRELLAANLALVRSFAGRRSNSSGVAVRRVVVSVDR